MEFLGDFRNQTAVPVRWSVLSCMLQDKLTGYWEHQSTRPTVGSSW